jgi:hypothetical protein
MTTIKFQGHDKRDLIELLIDAATTGEDPSIEVDGKTFDLLKVVWLLPDEPLQPHHQEKIDKLFKKRQRGYQRTGYNLAHRAHSAASHKVRLQHLREFYEGNKTKLRAESEEEENSELSKIEASATEPSRPS